MSRLYRLRFEQFIEAPLSEVWHFMSVPDNLVRITPSHMKFLIQPGYHATDMYAGQIIYYKLFPFPWLPVRWISEITQVSSMKYFIDEQRSGPYSFWHHKHLFESVNGGTLMTDIIDYRVPPWIIGDLLNTILIRRTLKSIFEFRHRALSEIFQKKI